MKSNFSSELMLCTNTVQIEDKRGGMYTLILPTLRDKLENMDFDIFISFCAVPLEDINQQIGANFKNRFGMFKAYKSNKIDIIDILDKYFKKFMIGFKYVDDSLYWGNRLVGEEIFEAFCNYCSIAAGVKSIDELKLVITPDMDEFEKKRIEMERKINKTKVKGEKGGEKESPLSLILTGVIQTFGYTYEQLLDKTIYSIYYMYSQLGCIMQYEVGNIAAGNGLMKKNTKHKHWAQKA